MLAIEPTDSRQASEPAEPMDKIEPAEPIDKMEPVEPMDRMDPLEPMLRIDPDEPAERDEPSLIPMGSFCRNGHRTIRPWRGIVRPARPVPGEAGRNSLGDTQGAGVSTTARSVRKGV